MEGSTEPSRNAKESLDLAYQMSQLLGTGLDRYTLSLLIALCDRGVNPEALSALVRELSPPPPPVNGSGTVGSGASNGSVNLYASSSANATGGGGSSFRSNFRQY